MSLANYEYPNGYKEERRREKLNGVFYFMTPSATIPHGESSSNIEFIFKRFLRGRQCRAFGDKIDVFLTKDDTVIPDVMIVCNRDIIKENGIHGAPDLIVEILSLSTSKRDKGYKKDLYERCGIKEYWIVDTKNKTIEVYLLKDGKFNLDNLYFVPNEDWLNDDRNDERDKVVYEFKTSLFDDLIIDIREVFEGIDDFS